MEIIRKTQLCGRHLGSSTESDIKQAMQSSGGDIMSDCIILSKHLETIARNNYFRSFDRGRALWLGQKKINDLRKQAEDDDTSVRALQNGLNRAFLSNIEKLKLINRLTLTGVPNKDEKIFFFGIETEGDKLTIFEGIRKRDRFAELRIKNFTYDSNFPVSIDKDISFRIGSEYIKPADLNLNHIIRAGEQLDIYLKEQKVIIPAPEKPRFHSKKDYLIALKAVAHEVKASLSYRHNAIAPYFKEQINSR
jgi:hypothetical protein